MILINNLGVIVTGLPERYWEDPLNAGDHHQLPRRPGHHVRHEVPAELHHAQEVDRHQPRIHREFSLQTSASRSTRIRVAYIKS